MAKLRDAQHLEASIGVYYKIDIQHICNIIITMMMIMMITINHIKKKKKNNRNILQ